MRYAVVDTGSNTIRMSVYECKNGKIRELFTEAVFANLAAHITDNHLTDEGIAICCDAIKKHEKTAKEYDAAFCVFATAAIRNAKNCEEIVKKVKENTNIDLDILSGTDEGELSFLGAYSDFSVQSGVMADVGGGSSEIIAFENGKIKALKSIPLGSLAAYKKFVSGVIPTPDELECIQKEIKAHLDNDKNFKNIKSDTLCLVGGGVLAARKLSEAFLKERDSTISGVNTLMSLLASHPDAEQLLENLIPKRKLTITPGLSIYAAIGKYFCAEKIEISDKGIKEGYLKKYLLH